MTRLISISLFIFLSIFSYSCVEKVAVEKIYENFSKENSFLNKNPYKNLKEKGYKIIYVSLKSDRYCELEKDYTNLYFKLVDGNIYASINSLGIANGSIFDITYYGDEGCYISITDEKEYKCNIYRKGKEIFAKKLTSLRPEDESECTAYYYIDTGKEKYLTKFTIISYLGLYILVEYANITILMDNYNKHLANGDIQFFENLTNMEKKFLSKVNVYDLLDIKSISFNSYDKFIKVVQIIQKISGQPKEKIVRNIINLSLDKITDLKSLEYVYKYANYSQKRKIENKLNNLYIELASKEEEPEKVKSLLKHCQTFLGRNCYYTTQNRLEDRIYYIYTKVAQKTNSIQELEKLHSEIPYKYKQYKKIIMQRIESVYEKRALSSNNIIFVRSVYKKYSKNKKIKNHLVSLLVSTNDFYNLLEAYKISPSISILRKMSKYAKTKKEEIELEKAVFDFIKNKSQMVKVEIIPLKSPKFKTLEKKSEGLWSFVTKWTLLRYFELPVLIKVSLNDKFPFKPAYGIYSVNITINTKTYGKYKRSSLWLGFANRNTYENDRTYVRLKLIPPYRSIETSKTIKAVFTYFQRGGANGYSYFYPLKDSEIYIEEVDIKYEGINEKSNLDLKIDISKLESIENKNNFGKPIIVKNSKEDGQKIIHKFTEIDKYYMIAEKSSSRSYSSSSSGKSKCSNFYRECKNICSVKGYCYKCDEFLDYCNRGQIENAVISYCSLKCRGLNENNGSLFSSSSYERCENRCYGEIKVKLKY